MTASGPPGGPPRTPAHAAGELRAALPGLATPGLADSVQRYFPYPVAALGVRNADVTALAHRYFTEHAFPPAARLEIAETLLAGAVHHEEVLLGFAALHKVARGHFDAGLLDRFRHWLETYVSNWAQCDDLCLKTGYRFLLGHPELITATGDWLGSASPWARRAANVAVVKFVHRRIGREVYELPPRTVFDRALRLAGDPDPYVRKSTGWLLKVTAHHHPGEATAFLRAHAPALGRDVLRTAVEKLPADTRGVLLAPGR